MIPVLSHNIPIGDVLAHGSCGNTFHYLALRWSLGRSEPIPVMICPKCHMNNDSGAAVEVAKRIWEKFLEAMPSQK